MNKVKQFVKTIKPMGSFFALSLSFYLIKHFAHIYLYEYMLAIAVQTAGPNGLTFFEGTHGCPGSNIG